MKLIIGLGNPGSKYENTRHNVGFMYVDHLAELTYTSFTEKKNYQIADTRFEGERVLLLKPMTFMNLSGEAVHAVIKFYKIDIEDIIVVYDDLDMDFGKLRAKYKSSSGGHNGIKNMISHLHTQEFMRIKVGIKNEHKRDVKSFVLSKLSKQEINELQDQFISIDKAMSEFMRESDLSKIQGALIK